MSFHKRKEVSSAYSSVKLDIARGIVIKKPVASSLRCKELWYEHQKRQEGVLLLLSSKSKVNLPKILQFNFNEEIETYLPGVPLTHEIFSKLDIKSQRKLAKQTACFLFDLHSIYASKEKCKPHTDFFKSSVYYKVFQLQKPFLKQYSSCLNFLAQKQTPLPKVLCYYDLKASHLLYDEKTKKLSIIDFGAVDFDIPIADFCIERPLASRLSMHFLNLVIEEYNKLSDNIINKDFVYAYLYCTAFKELRTTCKKRKKTIQEITLSGQILQEFLIELNQAFSK